MTRTVRLGDLCEMRSGGTPRRGVDGYYGGTIPWVTIADMTSSGSVVRETAERITEAGLAAIGNRLLEPGTILLAMYGSVGKLAIAGSRLATNQAILGLRPKEPSSLEPRYLMRWLASIQTKLVFHARGVTQANISKGLVEELAIPLPPLAEQRRVADMLEKADGIRRKRKEAIALTEELLRSAFLDMFGDPVANPKGWSVVKVEDLCSAVVDCPHTTPKYDGDERPHPCVRTSDLQDGFLDWSTTKYVGAEEYRVRIARLTPVAGDVLYTREGERYGIAAIIPEGVQACLGQRMMLLRPDAKRATSGFLWALMNSAAVYRQARAEVGGSTSPHVNVKAIRHFQAVRPPPELQRQYSLVCDAAFRGRSREIEALTETDHLFNTLVANAFSSALEGPP